MPAIAATKSLEERHNLLSDMGPMVAPLALLRQHPETQDEPLSKHRSVINAFVHIIAAITAYQINPIKPKRNLQPRYQLEITV